MTALPRTLSEAQFQRTVIDTAMVHGWLVSHFRPAQVRTGRWATPLTGHPGMPDLVLARSGVLLLAELKAEKGRLSPGQRSWADALGAHYRLWRPSDFESIKVELRDGPETADA